MRSALIGLFSTKVKPGKVDIRRLNRRRAVAVTELAASRQWCSPREYKLEKVGRWFYSGPEVVRLIQVIDRWVRGEQFPE